MAHWKPDELFVLAEIGETQRAAHLMKKSKDAAAMRQLTEAIALLVTEAVSEQALELSVSVNERQRAVARAGQLAGRVDHLLKHEGEIQARRDTIGQPAEQPKLAP
jgi:hypothetical protein